MKWCIEYTRKPGTINANQAERSRRIEVTGRDVNEAVLNAAATAARSGMDRFFKISTVRKI